MVGWLLISGLISDKFNNAIGDECVNLLFIWKKFNLDSLERDQCGYGPSIRCFAFVACTGRLQPFERYRLLNAAL